MYQKTLDTYKYYIKMRPEAPGVWANMVPKMIWLLLYICSPDLELLYTLQLTNKFFQPQIHHTNDEVSEDEAV